MVISYFCLSPLCYYNLILSFRKLMFELAVFNHVRHWFVMTTRQPCCNFHLITFIITWIIARRRLENGLQPFYISFCRINQAEKQITLYCYANRKY